MQQKVGFCSIRGHRIGQVRSFVRIHSLPFLGFLFPSTDVSHTILTCFPFPHPLVDIPHVDVQLLPFYYFVLHPDSRSAHESLPLVFACHVNGLRLTCPACRFSFPLVGLSSATRRFPVKGLNMISQGTLIPLFLASKLVACYIG